MLDAAAEYALPSSAFSSDDGMSGGSSDTSSTPRRTSTTWPTASLQLASAPGRPDSITTSPTVADRLARVVVLLAVSSVSSASPPLMFCSTTRTPEPASGEAHVRSTPEDTPASG